MQVKKLTAAQTRIRRTHRPHALERLARPLALTRWLDAARRALAARAFFAGVEALGLGAVGRATCGRDAAGQAGGLVAGHGFYWFSVTVIVTASLPVRWLTAVTEVEYAASKFLDAISGLDASMLRVCTCVNGNSVQGDQDAVAFSGKVLK